jgi:MFS family permease
MPERSERTGDEIRVREAVALVRENPRLRRLLLGTAANGSIRASVIPFAIVMMRREVGFSEAQVILCTFVYYAGGLASLYLWGRVCDRIGAAPVFLMTTLGLAALLLLIGLIDAPDQIGMTLILIFFGGHAIFSSGFGVADTQVLFRLTPSHAPARTLVIAGVLTSSVQALAPILVGLALQQALQSREEALAVYHHFFALAAIAQVLVFLPLRSIRR